MGDQDQKMYPPLGQQQPPYPQQNYPPQGGFQPMPGQVHHQPPSYDMSGGQPHPQVITQQPTTIIVQTARLGPDPQSMACPICKANIVTSVKYEPATKTHLFAGLICLLGCWCGCCMIPYCVDSCQNANHSCPNCGNYLGKYD